MLNADPPNPGSREALKQGCKCPVLDNHNGKGFPWGDVNPAFWINEACPLHGNPDMEGVHDEA